MSPDQGKFAHSSAQASRSDLIAELRLKHRMNAASHPNDNGGLLLKPPSQLRYHLIEPLRGIAAVWVFVFHFSFSLAFQSAFPACHALLKAGDRAVPMFFVISGYCLAVALSRAIVRGQSFRDFLMQRARRIYPTFWLSIVVIIAMHWGGELLKGSLTGEWNSLNFGRFRHYDWFDWIKIASLTQIFDQRSGVFFGRFGHVNGAYWTLGIEFQFYLIVALGLLRPRWFLPLTSVLTAVSLTTYYHPNWRFYVLNSGTCVPFFSWFALGMAVHALFENGVTPERLFQRHAKLAAGITIAGLATVFLVSTLMGHEVERLVFATGFAVALWAGKSIDLPDPSQQTKSRSIRTLFNQAFCLLGAMSYSIYLIHNQTSDSWRSLLNLGGIRSSILADLMCVGLTLVCCYPFYLVCEAPFVKGKKAAPIAEIPSSDPTRILKIPSVEMSEDSSRKAA